MRVTPWLALVLAVAACDFDSGGSLVDAGPVIDGTPPDIANNDDNDNDGVLNGVDNCPSITNVNQHDEDNDTVGDACDNCPTVANQDQVNQREVTANAARDGAGDACDPFPAEGGNDILFFDSFANRDPLWRSDGGVWTVANDAASQTDPTTRSQFYYAGDPHGDVVVDITVRLLAQPAGGFAIGTVAQWDISPGAGVGYLCQLFDIPTSPITVGEYRVMSTSNPFTVGTVQHNQLLPKVTPADAWTLRHAAIGEARTCAATSSAGFTISTTANRDVVVPTGRWGLTAGYAAMRFENIVVYRVSL